MGEKRSNHTVYNVNYHFVWCRQSEIDCLQIVDLQCPKYRHAILEPIENSLEASFREVCDEYGTTANADVNGAENIRQKISPRVCR